MNYLFGQIKLAFGMLVLLICTQAATLNSCIAQSYSFVSNREKDRIRFSLVKNLIVIPVYLNNKGPYNFILDTGVSLLLITDPSIADSLELSNQRTIKISGYGGGEEMEAMVSNDLSVSVGNLRLWDVPSAVLKSDVFNLSNYLGIKVYGLIGYPFFKDLLVQINYDNKTLAFQSAYLGVKNPGEAVPIELIDQKPFVRATINCGQEDLELKLIIDNGASHALSLESYHSAPFPLPPKTIPANLGVGLGGKISGSIGRTQTVTIGPYRLKNVLSSFPDYADVGFRSLKKERNGNLGADFLRHFNVTLDYSNAVMYLKKSTYFKDPFDHDMSGLEIYFDEELEKGYFIGRVEPESPADLAGLLPEDQLVAINFKSVSHFTLDEICAMMKAKEGRSFVFEVYRNGDYLMKIFKLKKRI